MLRTEAHQARHAWWVAAFACCASAHADPGADLTQREQAQRTALTLAIGTPRCTHDAQCWAVPVGARPCGGPEVYWPASKATADAARVASLAADLATTRRAQHQAQGRVGVCTFLPEPTVRCDAASQRCVLSEKALPP